MRSFNELFGNIPWNDKDKIRDVIAQELPPKVAADRAYQNAMKNSDKPNARIEHDKALERVMTELIADHTELFKQFSDNPGVQEVVVGHDFRRYIHVCQWTPTAPVCLVQDESGRATRRPPFGVSCSFSARGDGEVETAPA